MNHIGSFEDKILFNIKSYTSTVKYITNSIC